MRTFLIRRLASMLGVLAVVAIATFLIIFLAPGDPAVLMLGDQADQESVARLHREMGLDRPLLVRLVLWFAQLVRGDLGRSIYHGEPVLRMVLSRVEPSLLVALLGTGLAVVLGVPLGVLAATRRAAVTDRLIMAGSVLGLSVPSFWMALNLILLFSVYLRWTPVSGYVPVAQDPWETLRALILPCVSVGITQAAWLARVTRSAMLEVLLQEYVRTARSKGLRERVVLTRHALRNVLLPVVTVTGIVMITLFSSAVIIEVIFGLPGIGRLVTDSVLRRDYPVIQGSILFVAVCFAFINLLVDLAYVYLDPRVHYA
ncbi:MAG: ABC transporter permease [Armatimonadetes bacterium]|nr:ABC transporter permease [Armatimonadota bacterium]